MTCRDAVTGTVLLLAAASMQAQTLMPPVLPGEMTGTIAGSETGTQNVISMGLKIADQFDDNAPNDDHNKQANLLTALEPHVGWLLSAPKAQWLFDYRPGFSIGHPLSIYNSRSQLLDTNLQLALTKHLELRLRENLLQSKNVFDQLQQSEPTPGSSVLDRPNNSVLTAARESSEQAGADLTYMLSPRTVVGASTAFYRVNYGSALGAQPLGSARSVGMHAFGSYHLTRHTWIGFDYNLQKLISQQPESRFLVQSWLYTQTLTVTPSISVSVFAGPQHLMTRSDSGVAFTLPTGLNSEQANWSWAGGANCAWTGARTSLTVRLARRISDGAGLLGVVQLISATAQFRRQLSKRMQGQLLVAADRNKSFASNLTSLSYFSFSGAVSRALNQRLSVEFQYWRMHETSGAQASYFLADHNQASVSLLYDFKAALQR